LGFSPNAPKSFPLLIVVRQPLLQVCDNGIIHVLLPDIAKALMTDPATPEVDKIAWGNGTILPAVLYAI
jgi:hypothetical protein